MCFKISILLPQEGIHLKNKQTSSKNEKTTYLSVIKLKIVKKEKLMYKDRRLQFRCNFQTNIFDTSKAIMALSVGYFSLGGPYVSFLI